MTGLNRPGLLAISDLHAGFDGNLDWIDGIRPGHPGDWLIVAGDVADRAGTVVDVLRSLRERFTRVIWAPGNHDLWTPPTDPVTARGEARYSWLIDALRGIDVVTPEDDYPVWAADSGPIVVVPLFLLYDYSWLPGGASTREEAVAVARTQGVVCSDEFFLHPDPHASRAAWCRARLDTTRARLDALPAGTRTVLVNHFPLERAATRRLWRPAFALWSGTEATAGWATRYGAVAVVTGHLHIPVPTVIDGITHFEVSLGYPRERNHPRAPERRVWRILDGA